MHDHCAGFNPMTVVAEAMAELELERHGVEWVQPEIPVAYPLPDGTAIALHRSLDATAESLNAAAAGAGEIGRAHV